MHSLGYLQFEWVNFVYEPGLGAGRKGQRVTSKVAWGVPLGKLWEEMRPVCVAVNMRLGPRQTTEASWKDESTF